MTLTALPSRSDTASSGATDVGPHPVSPAAPELAPASGLGSHQRRIRSRTVARPAAEPGEAAPRWSAGAIAVRVAIAAAVSAAFAASLFRLGAALVDAALGGELVTVGLGGFAGLVVAHFLATVVLALRYRPAVPPPDAKLPSVTVIVPAYNEGAAVRVALESALAADYPEGRLEILAIDDGSSDDTWQHIEAVAGAARGRVRALRQPRNQGKREALRLGFEEASGDVVVTVDSDSKIGRGAIRSIVAPMCADPEVGAVAGRVLVLNRGANLWTRLLSARFVVTFDLARAAQSHFGAVLCTPGALSAYRASAVRAVLGRWSTQTFLGHPCTIAEDRALTTWILREGFRSVYQRTAVVETIVPTTLSRIARMMIRWERGNIREGLVMLPVLPTAWRPRDRWWPAFEIVVELLQHPVGWVAVMLALPALLDVTHLPTVFGLITLGALAQSLYVLRSERLSEFFYGTLYALGAMVGLAWLFPYSLATVRDGRWLTR
jgi:hyaluronan synthase